MDVRYSDHTKGNRTGPERRDRSRFCLLFQLVRIQVQIQETLIRQYSHHPSVKNAVSQLDSELMDITKVTAAEQSNLLYPRGATSDVDKRFLAQLYGEFADHFKLSECKLAIIHCGGHSDPILVQSLWQEIMEKGKCRPSRAAGVHGVHLRCQQ